MLLRLLLLLLLSSSLFRLLVLLLLLLLSPPPFLASGNGSGMWIESFAQCTKWYTELVPKKELKLGDCSLEFRGGYIRRRHTW